jgi:predicted TIM-barrel fold metal-dependent hydrolase
MTATMEAGSASKARPRVLVSADAHGGAPLGELEGVLNRIERGSSGGEGAIRIPAILSVDDGTGLDRDPQVAPADRLEEMRRDGVSAEVIYGGTGLFPGESLEDGIRRCQRTNDWMAETYGAHLAIMAPSIALPIPTEPYGGSDDWPAPGPEHIAAAVAEIRRTAALGLRPALLPDTSPKLGYNRPDWNPVWEAACEADVALSFHVGFGTNPVRHRNPGGAITNYVTVASNIIATVSQLCSSGVLETFPQLRCVMTESNAGWLAWVMFQMDEAWKKHQHWAKPKLAIPPSEYCKRNVQVTFQEDPVAVANRHFTGLKCLMWGSDYPHWEGTWPNSAAAVEKLFAGVPDDEVDQMVRRNAVETFNFKI